MGDETANFVVTRGQGNDQMQFNIRVYIQDGANKRYKIVALSL
jgi:hypothetical protein